MPKIIITHKKNKEDQVHSLGIEEVLIGRSSLNGIELPSNGVSRNHAKILHLDGEYYLIDTSSGNGTILNGVRLNSNEKNILRHDDKIQIEDYHLRFSKIEEMLNQSFNDLTDSDVLEVKLLKKVLGALDRETLPSFEVLNGSSAGKKFSLTEDMSEIIIGREEGVDFQIDEYVISRHHVKINKGWGSITIEDLGSKNGTTVNKTKVKETTDLHDGDRISLGTIVIIFKNPNEVNVEKLSDQIIKEKKQANLAKQNQIEKLPELEENKPLKEEFDDVPLENEPSLSALYPSPRKQKPKKTKLSPLEIGMIGLGIVVLLFAAVTIINLLMN